MAHLFNHTLLASVSKKSSRSLRALLNKDGEGTSTPRSRAQSQCPSTLQDYSEEEKGLPERPTSLLVDWVDENDPGNPRNWPVAKKWITTVVVCLYVFMPWYAVSMLAPAIRTIGMEFTDSDVYDENIMLSIFLLGLCVGPLFAGPASEVGGRMRVLHVANAVFTIFNLACGFAQNEESMWALRLMTGIAASVPLAIGSATIGDIWPEHQRGRPMSLWLFTSQIGPHSSPVPTGFIVQYASWRWIFWSSSIASAVILAIGLLLLEETYAPRILYSRAEALRKQTGNLGYHTTFELPDPKTSTRAILRPIVMLFTQPIVLFIGVYIAYLAGILYLVVCTFFDLWVEDYGTTIGIGGLHYASLGVGVMIATATCAFFSDHIYAWLKERNGGVGRAEYHLPLFLLGVACLTWGRLFFGWSAQYHLPWICEDIGGLFSAMGAVICGQAAQTYLVDTYGRMAASATCATLIFRGLGGFAFPFFAPAIYGTFDAGWANMVLGFIGFNTGLFVLFMIWRYGPDWRKRSKFSPE